jgi:glycogen operon protein
VNRYWERYGTYLAGDGVDVVIWAPEATRVEFCLLDRAGDAWVQRSIDLMSTGYGNWTGHVSGVGAGQHYGFRVHGKWAPEEGYYFNPAKLLVDPYAQIVESEYHYSESVLPYEIYKPNATSNDCEPLLIDGKMQPNSQDSAPFVPHSVVAADFDAKHPPIFHPQVPWRKTVIYEMHVSGFTKQAHWLPEELRGTYAGLADSQTIAYLKELGVTTIELLPIHSRISEVHLLKNKLQNYWGYSTLSFFAPNPEYATKAARESGGNAVIDELRRAIHTLHEAGIEVLLDVVYNHSCEESNIGPMLCYRGIANRNYYLHNKHDFATLNDTTGCGNALNFTEPHMIRLAHDSLRYWATQIGVDGFRFDLMVTCARTRDGFSNEHAFLTGIRNDPVLGNLKMIAEPWDLGVHGWRTGGFGFPFSEWNDSFRNTVRTFWVEDQGRARAGYSVSSPQNLATKISGSSDIFGTNEDEPIRGPLASINYVTAHDGFTLNDLVSYNVKHNEANMEDNVDGTTDNHSYNFGEEGLTNNRRINVERTRAMRNLLGTLLLSSGVPMITAGDEFGRTQQGNNNSYCQDSPISWLNWEHQLWQNELLQTARHLLWIRRNYPALTPMKFFTGEIQSEHGFTPDLCWFRPNGLLFTSEEWHNSDNRCFQAFFGAPNNGEENSEKDVLLVVNGRNRSVTCQLPNIHSWRRIWSSSKTTPSERFEEITDSVKVDAFSIQVFTS